MCNDFLSIINDKLKQTPRTLNNLGVLELNCGLSTSKADISCAAVCL